VNFRELMRISMRIPEMVLFKQHHLHWIKLKKLILLPCHLTPEQGLGFLENSPSYLRNALRFL
jgi:hypothetical protein